MAANAQRLMQTSQRPPRLWNIGNASGAFCSPLTTSPGLHAIHIGKGMGIRDHWFTRIAPCREMCQDAGKTYYVSTTVELVLWKLHGRRWPAVLFASE